MLYQLASSSAALQFTMIFLSIGMLITSLEYLVNYKLFTSEGLLDWRIINIRWKEGPLKRFLRFVIDNNLFNALLIVRVILILTMVSSTMYSNTFWASMIGIAITYAITTLVSFYGSDGSDQMTNIILITVCLCAAPFTNDDLIFIGFLFIAAQSCLSYLVAGVSKLFSKAWRNGSAVQDIFRTRTYGSEKIYKFIKGKKGINLFLCWSVIIIEMLFPLVLFLPLQYGIVFLVWGITFHFLNSVIMGLNTFFWAFLASYPSIIYINLHLANYMS